MQPVNVTSDKNHKCVYVLTVMCVCAEKERDRETERAFYNMMSCGSRHEPSEMSGLSSLLAPSQNEISTGRSLYCLQCLQLEAHDPSHQRTNLAEILQTSPTSFDSTCFRGLGRQGSGFRNLKPLHTLKGQEDPPETGPTLGRP